MWRLTPHIFGVMSLSCFQSYLIMRCLAATPKVITRLPAMAKVRAGQGHSGILPNLIPRT